MPPKIFLCSLVLLLFLCLTFPLPGRANEEENEEEEEVWTTEKARARCVELAQLDPTFAVLNNFTHSSSEIIETESGLVAWNPCQVIEECGSSLCKKRRGRDGVWISMGGNLEEIARKDENGWEGISMKFVGGSKCPQRKFQNIQISTEFIISCGQTLDASLIRDSVCTFLLHVTTPRACSSLIKPPVAPIRLPPSSPAGSRAFTDFLDTIYVKGEYKAPAEPNFEWIISLRRPLDGPEGCEGALVCQIGETGAKNLGTTIQGISLTGTTIHLTGGKVGCGGKERMTTIFLYCPEKSELTHGESLLKDIHAFQHEQELKDEKENENNEQHHLNIPPMNPPTLKNTTEYCLCKYAIYLTLPDPHPLCSPYSLSLDFPPHVTDSPSPSFPTRISTPSSIIPISHPLDKPFISTIRPPLQCSCYLNKPTTDEPKKIPERRVVHVMTPEERKRREERLRRDEEEKERRRQVSLEGERRFARREWEGEGGEDEGRGGRERDGEGGDHREKVLKMKEEARRRKEEHEKVMEKGLGELKEGLEKMKEKLEKEEINEP